MSKRNTIGKLERERQREKDGGEKDRRDGVKIKMDSPAVYTKSVGGEYKHSMLEEGDLQVLTQETLTTKCLFVCVFGANYPSEKGGDSNLSN